ncbi:Rho termination factor N-terminal domain-containing protein [Cellulomonas sp. McL0617]|uniref:Rho termination factor N-terminal domain-containing protein n=1 Tax=Cellulomonas sp. McL0617 TaxID=3415675 RepID=UPI003CF295C2
MRDPAAFEALRVDRARRQGAPGGGDAPVADGDAPDGPSGEYEAWSVDDLRQRAAELGVVGRSTMSRAELIAALLDR